MKKTSEMRVKKKTKDDEKIPLGFTVSCGFPPSSHCCYNAFSPKKILNILGTC